MCSVLTSYIDQSTSSPSPMALSRWANPLLVGCALQSQHISILAHFVPCHTAADIFRYEDEEENDLISLAGRDIF